MEAVGFRYLEVHERRGQAPCMVCTARLDEFRPFSFSAVVRTGHMYYILYIICAPTCLILEIGVPQGTISSTSFFFFFTAYHFRKTTTDVGRCI